ncbi:MAG TPA: polysaccharide deacetylase family protein [Longimicrobiales bacterium]|nr:polysaccharide deacetylase family protein [Longimicrobiales bacterium]
MIDRVSRYRRVVGYAAFGWALLFAAPHTWWALGIPAGFPGGRASHQVMMTTAWRYSADVIVIVLCGIAALVALALRRPQIAWRWVPYTAAWIASGMLTFRGVAGLVGDGTADLIWWPSFLLGGILFGAAAWLAPARSHDAEQPHGRHAARGRVIALRATLMLAMLGALFGGAWRLHKSRTVQLFGDLVTAVSTTDSVIALTFDDGPSAPHTDSVLNLLRAARVRATFFVTGGALAQHPELGRKIVEQGHELGNHSYSHHRMVFKSQGTIRHEIEATDSLIRRAGFDGPIHFRPPYGKRLLGLPWYLARANRITVLATLEPDSRYHTAHEMVEHVIEGARPGSIVLLHVDLRPRSEERRALPRIIDGLRNEGYEFVTVSELMTRARPR